MTSIEAGRGKGPLNQRLSQYREQSGRTRPEFLRAYDDLVARLRMLDEGEIGPKVGQPMPPFHLPDDTGRLVSLDRLKRTGPVVVSFNRGHWCPYCKMDLRALAACYADIQGAGASVVSIMPDLAAYTSETVAANELPFPVLSDIDLGYALSLGLIFWVGDEIVQLYEGVGLDLERYQGNQSCFLPMAAKFIVGTDGLVKARQVNIEFRERMEPAAIVAVLNGLRRNG